MPHTMKLSIVEQLVQNKIFNAHNQFRTPSGDTGGGCLLWEAYSFATINIYNRAQMRQFEVTMFGADGLCARWGRGLL